MCPELDVAHYPPGNRLPSKRGSWWTWQPTLIQGDDMNNLTTTVDGYLAAWNETDPDLRAKLIEEVWATDGCLIDPPLAAQGWAGIGDMAAALQGQFPGHHFRRATGIDAHHNQLRFGWELVGPDDAVALSGLDVGETTDDGQLRRITGFFGDLPLAESA